MVTNKENLYKLGQKMTDRIPYKLGLKKLDESCPEYWGLAKVLDDDMVSIALSMKQRIRLMLPKVLLPATTALGTIHPKGRELGILAGANVVMPNLSPTEVRKDYLLYDNKICTGDESAQCRHCLERRMASVGYQVVTSRGDSLNI